MATFKSAAVTVTAAGTGVAFPSARGKCLWIKVVAKEGNTGAVDLGDSTVTATTAPPLYGGDPVEIDFSKYGGASLDSLYLDAATNGDGADFIAVLE